MDNIRIIKKNSVIYMPDNIAEKFNRSNKYNKLVLQNPFAAETNNRPYHLFGHQEYLTKDDFNIIKNNVTKLKINRDGVCDEVNICVNKKTYNLTYHGNKSKSHMVLSYEGDKSDPQKFMIYKIKAQDIKDEFKNLNDQLKKKIAPNMDYPLRKNVEIDTTEYETPLRISISYTTFFTHPREIKNILKKFLKELRNNNEEIKISIV